MIKNFKDILSERDLKNYKANLMEMSVKAATLAMIFMVKAALFNSDDDEESTQRRVHNYAVNKLMQISDQSSPAFLSPATIYDNIVNMAAIRFLADSQESLTAISVLASDGMFGKDDDTVKSWYAYRRK